MERIMPLFKQKTFYIFQTKATYYRISIVSLKTAKGATLRDNIMVEVELIMQEDGTLELCVAHRKLNPVIEEYDYPLARTDETLYTLSGNWAFLTLGLVAGRYLSIW